MSHTLLIWLTVPSVIVGVIIGLIFAVLDGTNIETGVSRPMSVRDAGKAALIGLTVGCGVFLGLCQIALIAQAIWGAL